MSEIKNENELELKVAVLEKEMKSCFSKLGELERKVEKIGDIAITTEKINTKMDMIREKIDYVDTRLRGLEETPKADLAYYKRAIVSALISGFLGTVIGAVMTVIIK